MKKFIMAVLAVCVVGLVTGCSTPRKQWENSGEESETKIQTTNGTQTVRTYANRGYVEGDASSSKKEPMPVPNKGYWSGLRAKASQAPDLSGMTPSGWEYNGD